MIPINKMSPSLCNNRGDVALVMQSMMESAQLSTPEEITQYGLWFSQILCQSAICVYLYFSFSYGNRCTGKFAEAVMNTIKRSLTAMANHTHIT